MVKTLAVGLLLMQICSVVQGIVTSCEDVSVYLGDPANITCVFSEDINQTRTGDFRVYRYDLYSRTEKEVLVLDCYWNDGAICHTTEGYSFNGTVSNRLTVIISHANETYQGRYECQVQPTDPTNVKQCRLTLKAGVKPTPSPGPTTFATLTTEVASDEEEDTNAAAVVVPIVLLIILGVAVAVVAYKYRERILARFPFLPCWRTQEDDTSNVERGTMHYANTAGSSQLPAQNLLAGHSDEQPEPETERLPLLTNQQSSNVHEADQHLSVQQHELAKTAVQEDEDKFEDALDNEAAVAAYPDQRAASHADTITAKSGKDAAPMAVDTKEETNENSSQASSRDYVGSFHQTSTNTTENSILPAPEPFADTLNHEKRAETHLGNKQDVVHPDIEDVEANLQTSGPFKLPIQATGETEHNITQTTQVNSDETHSANDGDISNTEEPAAPTTENLQETAKYDTAKADAMEQLIKLENVNFEAEGASNTDEDDKDNRDDNDDGDVDEVNDT